MNKMKLLISACLLGENCKYNGGNNHIPQIELLKEKYELIPICPEKFGGLPTPREPSEICDEKVINKIGEDVTLAFKNGADAALYIALENNCDVCILKERSPSCGVNFIYDGSFSNKIVEGSGITATLLREHGFDLYTEEDIENLIN